MVRLAGIWVHKQASASCPTAKLRHLIVMPPVFTACLYPEGDAPLLASGHPDGPRPCPEELKSLFIRTRLKLSGDQLGKWRTAHRQPLPTEGLRWRDQHASMCPCRLFLDSTPIPTSHFVSLFKYCSGASISLNMDHYIILCLKETEK